MPRRSSSGKNSNNTFLLEDIEANSREPAVSAASGLNGSPLIQAAKLPTHEKARYYYWGNPQGLGRPSQKTLEMLIGIALVEFHSVTVSTSCIPPGPVANQWT